MSDDILDIIKEAADHALGDLGDQLRRMAEVDRVNAEVDLRRLAILQSRIITRPADRELIAGESQQLVSALHFAASKYGLVGTVMARTFLDRLFSYVIDQLFAAIPRGT